MTPQQIQTARDAIWKMRKPLRVKADQSDFRYGDRLFRMRVEKIDRLAADKADAKELEEVYESCE